MLPVCYRVFARKGSRALMTDDSDETVNAQLVTKGQARVVEEVSVDVLVSGMVPGNAPVLPRKQLGRVALACGATQFRHCMIMFSKRSFLLLE
jgi:hypothetical protein